MKQFLLVLPLLIGFVVPVRAELVDQSATGFTSRSVHEFSASPPVVWTALTTGISQWWSSDHTFSGDASNLYLAAEAGGSLGEKLPSGGSVTHLEVIYADPGKHLRLRGGLGPLQGMAVVGVLTVDLAPRGEGTLMTVVYAVGGYSPAGLVSLAGPVDGVIVAQFDQLQAFVESDSLR